MPMERYLFMKGGWSFCDCGSSEGIRIKQGEEKMVFRVGSVPWIAAQILLYSQHSQGVKMNGELNVFNGVLDHIPLHAELWNAACDADFQKTLDGIE